MPIMVVVIQLAEFSLLLLPQKNVLLLLTKQETFAMLANGALNRSVNCPTRLQSMPGSNGMKSGLKVVK